jgi:hypothetical protein
VTANRFFRFTLLLPVVIGGIAIAFFPKSLPAYALVYGGIPYLVVAAIAYFAIGRARSLARLVSISMAMPLALMLLTAPLNLTMAAIGLFVGFGYAFLAWMLYALGRRSNLVFGMSPDRVE